MVNYIFGMMSSIFFWMVIPFFWIPVLKNLIDDMEQTRKKFEERLEELNLIC